MTPPEPAEIGQHWRRLGPADVAAVDALHRRALTTLAEPAWVRPEDTAFFEAVLGQDGFGIGIEAEGRLVAYGLVQTRLEPEDAATLPWPDTDPSGVAKLCGAAVDPGWRGRGLQAALARDRMEQGRALGCRRFFATAAPGNVPSWASLLRAGMQIAALEPRYGGLMRYVLVEDARRPEEPGVEVLLDDPTGQLARLALGWRGTGFHPGPAPALAFHACAA